MNKYLERYLLALGFTLMVIGTGIVLTFIVYLWIFSPLEGAVVTAILLAPIVMMHMEGQ